MSSTNTVAAGRAWLCPALLASLLLSLGACGGETEVVLNADQLTISAGGIEAATITARALIGGDPAPGGTQIYFEATNGSFERDSALQSTSGSADGNGRTVIKLFSAATQGTATVTASFTDDASGAYASSSITITFGPPAGTNRPVDGTFRLTCDALNIGALRAPMPDLQVTCRLSAQTRGHAAIAASALSPTFMTEAGQLTASEDYYTGQRVFLYSPAGGSSSPAEVEPDPAVNEPSYFDGNGRSRNPRDGLVTLVAVVDGEEAFTDANGNGQYDQGEPFSDAAEPFVDVNDNDSCDPEEAYEDVNGNGRWDEANGSWDEKTRIMAIYKILWTGELHNSESTSTLKVLSSGSTTINQGSQLEVEAVLRDINMNPIAAFTENQDSLEWLLGGSSDAITSGTLYPELKNMYGFDLDTSANTERKRWLILSNTWETMTRRLTVADGYPQDTSPPASYTLSAKAHLSAGPSGDGYYLTQVTEELTDRIEGTCD